MAGALLAYVLITTLDLPLGWAIISGAVLGTLLGLLIYFSLLPVRKEPPLSGMTLTYGVALILLYGMLELFGANLRNITPSEWIRPITLGPIRLALGEAVVLLVAFFLVGGTAWFLQSTWTGLAVRALAQNREAALALGISPLRTEALTLVLGSSLAGLAGSLLVTLQPVAPLAAPLYTAKAFVVVVLGGLSSPLGVGLAGLFLGVFEALAGLLNPALGELFVFGAFLLALLLGRQGLLGGRA